MLQLKQSINHSNEQVETAFGFRISGKKILNTHLKFIYKELETSGYEDKNH